MNLVLIATYVQNLMENLERGKETKSFLLGELKRIHYSFHCSNSADKGLPITNRSNEMCMSAGMCDPFAVEFKFDIGKVRLTTDGSSKTVVDFSLDSKAVEKYRRWGKYFADVRGLPAKDFVSIIENEISLIEFIDTNEDLKKLMNESVPKLMELIEKGEIDV